MPYLFYMKEYNCIKCDYKTVRKYNFDKHLNSNIHKSSKKSINKKCVIENGKNIIVYDCLSCKNIFYSKHNYLIHVLNCNTIMNDKNNESNDIMVSATNKIKKDEKNQQDIYHCELCDYTCHHKCNYDRHLLTKKHLNETTKMKDDNLITEHTYRYTCGICKFECNKKSNYNIHLQSKKHFQNMKEHETNTIMTNEQEVEINKMGNVEAFKNEVISTLMTQLSCVLEEHNKSILAEQTKLMIESQKK
jgi:hypothetical protein